MCLVAFNYALLVVIKVILHQAINNSFGQHPAKSKPEVVMGSESLICLNLTTVSFPGESPLQIQVGGSNKSARAVILDGSCSSQQHTSVYSWRRRQHLPCAPRQHLPGDPHRPPHGHRHQQVHGDPRHHLQLGCPRLPQQHFTPQFASQVAASFSFQVESKF